VSNTNVVVLEEFFKEEYFENCDQEVDIIQDKILDSVQMDEGESSFHIFNEHEEPDIWQENVVKMISQVNKFKTKEIVKKEKEKTKSNDVETTMLDNWFEQLVVIDVNPWRLILDIDFNP
jgi:hypothetical protein